VLADQPRVLGDRGRDHCVPNPVCGGHLLARRDHHLYALPCGPVVGGRRHLHFLSGRDILGERRGMSRRQSWLRRRCRGDLGLPIDVCSRDVFPGRHRLVHERERGLLWERTGRDDGLPDDVPHGELFLRGRDGVFLVPGGDVSRRPRGLRPDQRRLLGAGGIDCGLSVAMCGRDVVGGERRVVQQRHRRLLRPRRCDDRLSFDLRPRHVLDRGRGPLQQRQRGVLRLRR